MGISTIGRTLEAITAFERVEADFFREFSARATDQGSVLVASWLARRKPHVPEVLACYRPSEAEVIMKSPIFEELFESDAAGYFASRHLDATAPAEAVIDLAIECGRLFLECARHIAEQRLDRQVLDFARTFEAIALREVKELKKIRAMHYF